MIYKDFNPDKVFAQRIKEALAFYGLEEGDLGRLIGTNATDIRHIITLKRTLGLKRANKISSVFGMKYFEFGNPDIKFISKEQLPKKTFDAIAMRIKKGPSDNVIDTELNLPLHTMVVLKGLKASSEFTAKRVYEQLPNEIKSKVEASRLTVLFKTGSLRKYVEYANKIENKRHVYKFISIESKNFMEDALKKMQAKNKKTTGG